MKGKIDKYGTLYIERAGEMKDQLCPYASECGSPIACSDTCPLFGEPVFDEDRKMQVTGGGNAAGSVKVGLKESATLALCERTLLFDKFTDERNLDDICLKAPHD